MSNLSNESTSESAMHLPGNNNSATLGVKHRVV